MKIILRNAVLCSLLHLLSSTAICWSATYYVDATNGNDAKPGTSEATPWKTISKVNKSNFQPGDFILFKRGEIWREMLRVPSSGSSGNPIAFGAYGSGEKPIISARDDILGWTVSENWTNDGGNVWYIGSISANPFRIWLNTTEYRLAKTNQTNIDHISRWWWDNSNDRLYVYATSNPASFFSHMKGASRTGHFYAVNINSKSYITLENLDLRGGFQCVYIHAETDNVNHITVDKCNVGKYANQIGIYGLSWNDSYRCDYGIVSNCIIDSKLSLEYATQDYLADGIALGPGASHWDIYNNEIRDWNHNGINIYGKNNRESKYNKFHNNLITGENIIYMRGFSTDGADGTCSYNEIYHNIVRNTTVRSQIAGDFNLVYYNVIYGVTNNANNGFSANAQGISLEDLGESNNCHHNKIYNNVICNTDEAGIRVHKNTSSGGEIENNEIINNILVNCGNNSEGGMDDIALSVKHSVGSNIFKNNLMYKSGLSNLVSYRRISETVAEFNNANGSNEDIISDNIQSDPMFVNISTRNFQLKGGSPCIDAGLDVGLSKDFSGNAVQQGQGVDIGAFEYKFFPPPTNLRVVEE